MPGTNETLCPNFNISYCNWNTRVVQISVATEFQAGYEICHSFHVPGMFQLQYEMLQLGHNVSFVPGITCSSRNIKCDLLIFQSQQPIKTFKANITLFYAYFVITKQFLSFSSFASHAQRSTRFEMSEIVMLLGHNILFVPVTKLNVIVGAWYRCML